MKNVPFKNKLFPFYLRKIWKKIKESFVPYFVIIIAVIFCLFILFSIEPIIDSIIDSKWTKIFKQDIKVIILITGIVIIILRLFRKKMENRQV